MELSKRVQNVSPSATLALSAKAKQLQKDGYDVKNLTAGEPNFNTPEHIKKQRDPSDPSGKIRFFTPRCFRDR